MTGEISATYITDLILQYILSGAYLSTFKDCYQFTMYDWEVEIATAIDHFNATHHVNDVDLKVPYPHSSSSPVSVGTTS